MSVLKIKNNGTWIGVSTTNVVEESNSIYLTNVPISATTGDIASIIDSRITSESAVAEVTFANPSAITSDVTWITGNGSLVLNGTCTSATTANIVIVHVLDGSAPTNNGVIMVELWTNPNPNEAFAAQTVSLDLSGYDYFAVDVKLSSSSAQTVPTQWFPCGIASYALYIWGYNGQNGGRAITTASNGLAFGTAQLGGTNNNIYCIPLKIYGIKL